MEMGIIGLLLPFVGNGRFLLFAGQGGLVGTMC